jgi:hypothetical protein
MPASHKLPIGSSHAKSIQDRERDVFAAMVGLSIFPRKAIYEVSLVEAEKPSLSGRRCSIRQQICRNVRQYGDSGAEYGLSLAV